MRFCNNSCPLLYLTYVAGNSLKCLVFSLIISQFPFLSATAKLTMSVMSRFCLNMAANVGLQYAAELLPTPVRSQGVSFIHTFGIVAHSLAPYVIDSVSDMFQLVSRISCKNRISLSTAHTLKNVEHVFSLTV